MIKETYKGFSIEVDTMPDIRNTLYPGWHRARVFDDTGEELVKNFPLYLNPSIDGGQERLLDMAKETIDYILLAVQEEKKVNPVIDVTEKIGTLIGYSVKCDGSNEYIGTVSMNGVGPVFTVRVGVCLAKFSEELCKQACMQYIGELGRCCDEVSKNA